MEPKTIHSVNLPHNCDSVEINHARDRVFVGMYEYEESSSSRGGGFAMLDREGEVRHVYVNKDWGALDACWSSRDDTIVVASSDGIVRVYDCTDIDNPACVGETQAVQTPGSDKTENILMTIDMKGNMWSTITAKGELALFRDGNVISRIEAHSRIIESWACSLTHDTNMVASGSDDCALKIWDTRTSELVMQNTKSHTMGTTCLEFMSDTEILTGSYDDRIRRFDIRHIKEPVTERKSIGGIWRLKPCGNRIFVAACYGGCSVVDFADFRPIVSEYTKHESMAYGIGALEESCAVSCSFYDKLVTYWDFS